MYTIIKTLKDKKIIFVGWYWIYLFNDFTSIYFKWKFEDSYKEKM